MNNHLDQIKFQLTEASGMMHQMKDDCSQSIADAAQVMISALQNGNKILWCGNGGSAAQAQHLSTEVIGGLRDHVRPGKASLSLTTDSSFLTAWPNDVGFDTLFSRQVESLGQKGDVLIGISTSGNSDNIVKAVESAGELGMKVIVFTGRDGGKLAKSGDVMISIPSDDTQHIQEGHITAGHIVCELVEQAFS